MSLTPLFRGLFKGLDMPTEVGLTGAWEQFWPDAFLLTLMTHMGTSEK